MIDQFLFGALAYVVFIVIIGEWLFPKGPSNG